MFSIISLFVKICVKMPLYWVIIIIIIIKTLFIEGNTISTILISLVALKYIHIYSDKEIKTRNLCTVLNTISTAFSKIEATSQNDRLFLLLCQLYSKNFVGYLHRISQ